MDDLDQQQEREIARVDYEDLKDDARQRLPLLTEIALASLKALMVANGGAIVALFTFIGNAPGSYDPPEVWASFWWFVVGLAGTMAANILGYVTQSLYYQFSNHEAVNAKRKMHGLPEKYQADKYNRIGSVVEYFAVGAACLSLLGFVIGASHALSGVIKAPRPAVTKAAPAPPRLAPRNPAPPASRPAS